MSRPKGVKNDIIRIKNTCDLCEYHICSCICTKVDDVCDGKCSYSNYKTSCCGNAYKNCKNFLKSKDFSELFNTINKMFE